ncbi:hypothetical protein NDU88_007083 [Pleurodeles waltl]|uniref:Uncharacterized protein n=1 Tax=Pleurodeles waltl TaxID=8319 RepID=A0AAV7UMV3_PLEWA|nr:hypothetical protein NDU88_007083 [Pleurodeles waltl]
MFASCCAQWRDSFSVMVTVRSSGGLGTPALSLCEVAEPRGLFRRPEQATVARSGSGCVAALWLHVRGDAPRDRFQHLRGPENRCLGRQGLGPRRETRVGSWFGTMRSP